MLMFKAPLVKISEKPLDNQSNQFPVNIKSLNEEEVILQFAESDIEFCATVHQPNQWQSVNRFGFILIKSKLF